MKILVTGAFGYLGAAVAQHLASEGHDVTSFGRWLRTRDAAPNTVGTHVEIGDVRGLTAAGLRRFDAVVHLAGGAASGGATDPQENIHDNLLAAAHVARIAPSRTRLLLASSVYVYGRTDVPASEEDKTAPDTLYGCAKLLAESVWRERGGHVLRLAHVYGRSPSVAVRDGVTERLLRARSTGLPFAIDGDGRQTIDLICLQDVQRAVGWSLVTPRPAPVMNLTGGVIAIADLAALFGAPVVPSGRPALGPPRFMEAAVATRLGVVPFTPVADGVRQMIEGT